MTYGGFLLVFLVVPILILTAVQWRRLGRRRWFHLIVMMIVALLYTTPWDNYLVASRVWWYDPDKVSGLLLGYVPIEEYAFFLLQPLMTGLLLMLLRDRFALIDHVEVDRPDWRRRSVLLIGLPWLVSILLLLFGPARARYLSLELSWALPPFMLQLAFGADLLRRNWRPALVALGVSTGYLIAADAFAISQGIWMISERQTLGLNPAPSVVLEEMVFFFVTNLLVIGGLSLLEDPRSRPRLTAWSSRLRLGERQTP